MASEVHSDEERALFSRGAWWVEVAWRGLLSVSRGGAGSCPGVYGLIPKNELLVPFERKTLQRGGADMRH